MNRLSALLFIAVWALTVPAAAKPFSQIVDDQTDLFLTVKDLSGLRSAWLEHPLSQWLGEATRSGPLEALLAKRAEGSGPSIERMTTVLNDEFNLTWEAFFELFPGQFSVSLHNLPALLLGEDAQPDLAIMAEFSGTSEQLDALMQIQFERNAAAQQKVNPLIEHELVKENFMGETLYFDEVFDGERSYVEDGFVLVEGIFILAVEPERLRALVESIKDGTERPLDGTAAYIRFREDAPEGALTFFANLEAWLPDLNKALQNPKVTAPFAWFGVTGRSLELTLALHELRGFGFEGKLTEAGMETSSALIYHNKAGLLRLLTFGRGGLPAASYVPERVLASSVSNFDLTRMFAELQSLLAAASPTAGPLLDLQLQQMRTQTGVDFRAAVLENFTSELVSFSVLPERGPAADSASSSAAAAVLQPDQVYVIGIKDAASLSSAMEALKDRIPGMREQFESVPFKGELIYQLQAQTAPGAPGGEMPQFSYAITRSHLLVHQGRGRLLQEVISAMQDGGAGFWQQAWTIEAFEAITRPGAVSRSYMNLGQFAETILTGMNAAMGAESGAPDGASPLPAGLALPYQLISETNETDDGFFTRSRLLEMEAPR